MPRKRKKKCEMWPELEFEESPKSLRTSEISSSFSRSDCPLNADVIPIEDDNSLDWVGRYVYTCLCSIYL